MKLATNSLLVVVVLISTTLILSAQPPGGKRRGGSGDGKPPREAVENVRKMKLMDVMELEGDQVEKFFALYNPLQKALYEKKDALDKLSAELWRACDDEASEAVLTDLTAKVETARKAFMAAVDTRNAGVKPALSNAQYARYIAFEARFMDELQRMMLRKLRERDSD
jgi:hypothetical protein